MKKSLQQPHKMSSIARSASLFGPLMAGAGVIAYASEYDMFPYNGNGGGSSTIFPGGTQTITATSVTGSGTFSVSYSASCHGTSDQINCNGMVFIGGSTILTPLTAQGTCTSSSFVGTITGPCSIGQLYNVNFACLNQSTNTALSWTGTAGQSAQIQC